MLQTNRKTLFIRKGLHNKNKMMYLEKQSIDPSGLHVYIKSGVCRDGAALSSVSVVYIKVA